jgi:hypothetical protein
VEELILIMKKLNDKNLIYRNHIFILQLSDNADILVLFIPYFVFFFLIFFLQGLPRVGCDYFISIMR